ncbi:hypothetical protein JXI42_13735 [bacterium]|nr:hypothetical protein [bacterium]
MQKRCFLLLMMLIVNILLLYKISHADVLILKSGEIVECTILEVYNDSVKVSVDRTIQMFAIDDIRDAQPSLTTFSTGTAQSRKPSISRGKYSTPGEYFMKYVAEIGIVPGAHFLNDENRKEVFDPPVWAPGLRFGGYPIPYLGLEFSPFFQFAQTGDHQLYGSPGGFDLTIKGIAPTTTVMNPYLGGGITWAKLRTEEEGYYDNNGFHTPTSNVKIDWRGFGGHIVFGTEIYANPIISFILQGKYTFLTLEITKLTYGSYTLDKDEIDDISIFDTWPKELDMGGFDIQFGINFHFGPRP